MKIIAINGSPRKKRNTGTVLDAALAGAANAVSDCECERIDLYTLDYKGCISCFECKRIGGPSYGKCAVRDELQPVLQRALHADALIFGSPIYFSDVTGMTRCFFERLLFPCFVYDKDYSSIAPKKIHTGFIYTMNVPEAAMAQFGYPDRLGVLENFTGRVFGHKPKRQFVCDTYQFSDYSRYAATLFDEAAKRKQRDEQFPKDCEAAEALGAELARAARGA